MFFSGSFCGFERCGSAAFPNFRGGNFSEKCVRTNSRILHRQKEKHPQGVFFFLSVRPVGFEPTTVSLRASCSTN